MTGKHAAHGAAASAVTWLVSGWDHHLHAFRERGEIYSEAVCTHTAQTSRLSEEVDGARTCHACMLIVGGELTGPVGNRDIWSRDPAGQR